MNDQATREEMAYYKVWEDYTHLKEYVDQIGVLFYSAALHRDPKCMGSIDTRMRTIEEGMANLKASIEDLKVIPAQDPRTVE